MIRSALTPVIRQRRNQFAALCTGATIGYTCGSSTKDRKEYVEFHMLPSTVTECSSYVSADTSQNGDPSRIDDDGSFQKMSSPTTSQITLSVMNENLTRSAAHASSLIVPTVEALLRATRLMKTAAFVACDYQLHFIQNRHSDFFVSQWWRKIARHAEEPTTVDGEKQSSRYNLERTIEQLSHELEQAQHAYVAAESSTSKSEESQQTQNQNEDTLSLSERTLAKRSQKLIMIDVANRLAQAQQELQNLNENEATAGSTIHNVHRRGALRLLDLCRSNGGVYIKVGQHLANLDLLIPDEYIQELSSLFDNAPVSPYSDVCHVIKEDLGKNPSELFDDFSEKPIASASLAQVHTAKCTKSGKKLAIKVQHRGLRETSRGDLFAMNAVVRIAEWLFEDFSLGWIADELTPQLPKELDFTNEGRNAEAAAEHLERTGLDCVVPRVLWNTTTERVLTMDFEEGFRATDIASIENAGLCRRDVAKLISSVFNAQIFQNGFVHCDPHEANVLLREHPRKKGRPQIVLVDHGLYKKLDAEFQESYARLWKAIVMADISGIKTSCESLGVKTMYPLLAAMLTSRPFDEVVERSQTRSLDASHSNGSGDKEVIKGYAQRYIKEIISMLDIVPRQMLLIFKMNDCLRHVDHALGSPMNTLAVAGRYASKRVFDSDQKLNTGGFLKFLRSWMSYVHVLFRINSYELWTRLKY